MRGMKSPRDPLGFTGARSRVLLRLVLCSACFAGALGAPLPAQEQPTGGEAAAAPATQDPAPAQPEPQDPKPDGAPKDSREVLDSIRQSIDVRQVELDQKRETVKTQDGALKVSTTEEVERLQTEILNLKNQFEEIATSVDISKFRKVDVANKPILQELEELARPVLEMLKSATDGPRRKTQLTEDKLTGEEKVADATTAIANVTRLITMEESSPAPNQALLKDLQGTLKTWEQARQKEQVTVQLATRQIILMEAGKKPFLEMVSEEVQDFFKSTGFHLLLGLAAFFAVYLGIRVIVRSALRTARKNRGKRERSFYSRLLKVIYTFSVAVLGVIAMLGVFYAVGNWTLLAISLLLILGLLLAARTALPHMVEQVRLLLDLGAVREGERIIWNDLPWKVESLNLHSRLVNPALAGGTQRVPLRDLVGMHSRPAGTKELWFPSKEGDWVVIDDSFWGRVVLQTPEMVQIVRLGGARKTIPTGDYLSAAPTNLSMDFRIAVTFGIDYEHQAICTTEVAPQFQARLEQEIPNLVSEDTIRKLNVEFKEAGASSLDFAVLADFSGEAASKYSSLRRAIQRILVDVCNEQGYGIPFTQVTVHEAAGNEGGGNGGAALTAVP